MTSVDCLKSFVIQSRVAVVDIRYLEDVSEHVLEFKIFLSVANKI